MAKKTPLPDMWNVPDVFRRRLRESIGRQRAMFADGHLLLVLHEPPTEDPADRRPRLFWRSPDGTWQSNTLGSGIAALGKHLTEYREAVEKLDEAESGAESADEYFGILRAIAPLVRASRNMHDTLQEARETVSEDANLIICRDQAYQIARSAELLQSDAKTGLDCAIARRAEEEARSSQRMAVSAHRLNVLAAIFFPLVTISSIFGMNLNEGLDEKMFLQPLFWAVLAVGVGLGLFLKALIVVKPDRPRRIDPNKAV
ncbi:MAG: CorA family divalent cation transporter [Planctomycetota bacterium]|jgi:hypothetical protein